MTKLKLCPFCGGVASLIDRSDIAASPTFVVRCLVTDCKMSPTTGWCQTKEEAAIAPAGVGFYCEGAPKQSVGDIKASVPPHLYYIYRDINDDLWVASGTAKGQVMQYGRCLTR